MDLSIPLGPTEALANDPARPVTDRDRQICERYRKGETLAGIGQSYGVSAERVRKIVKRFGLDKRNAGLAIRNSHSQRKQRKAPSSLRIYGCSAAELDAVPVEQRHAFLQQRTNVKRSAGVSWDLSLIEWVAVWNQSEKWDQRGQGPSRYGLSRININGSYCIENVHIATNHESAMRGRGLKSAARRREALKAARTEKWIREMARILKKSSAPDDYQTDTAEQQ
jgi:Sigma-70, region 4